MYDHNLIYFKSYGKIPTYLEKIRQQREEEAQLKEIERKSVIKKSLRPMSEDENHELLLKVRKWVYYFYFYIIHRF